MTPKKCHHTWQMVDVTPGFIMLEQCFRCSQACTHFSAEKNPPLEEYREGDHVWNVSSFAQTIRFNLQCRECGEKVDLGELLGVMMCTGCDKDCEVCAEMEALEPKRTWVYVAFGALPLDVCPQPSPEKLAILETYFNQRRKSSKSTIRIVSSERVRNVLSCFSENIGDVDLLSLKPPAAGPEQKP